MKTLKHILYSLFVLILSPSLVLASTTSSSALASQIQAVGILNQISSFLSGQLLIAIAVLFGIIAAYGFLKSKRGHGSRWESVGRVGLFLVIATSIGGVIRLLFSGAVI